MPYVRKMKLFDLENLAELELAILGKWAVGENEITQMVRSYNGKDTLDTRSKVIEDEANEEILGGFIYELHPRHFEVIWAVLTPNEQVIEIFANYLRELIEKSPKRRRAVLYLHDDDDTFLRVLHPSLVRHGFISKLAPGHFDNCDGWRLSIDC